MGVHSSLSVRRRPTAAIVDRVTTGGERADPGVTGAAELHGQGPGADAVARRWRAAESHLYPLIVSDPDLYELAVTLVVEAREVLRSRCSTVAALIASDPTAVLAECPAAQAVRDGGFDPVTAFDAARAQLLRELPGAG